jgi:hypothetical protein
MNADPRPPLPKDAVETTVQIIRRLRKRDAAAASVTAPADRASTPSLPSDVRSAGGITKEA